MLETYVDTFIFIVKEIFKLITDSRLTEFLGVNLLGAIVTGILMMIVFKTLINPTAIGSMAVDQENIRTLKSNKEAAIHNATQRNKFYKASVDYMRDHKNG